MIKVIIVSKCGNLKKNVEVSPNYLLNLFGIDNLIEELTDCECQTQGMNTSTECECYEMWEECRVFLDGKEVE